MSTCILKWQSEIKHFGRNCFKSRSQQWPLARRHQRPYKASLQSLYCFRVQLFFLHNDQRGARTVVPVCLMALRCTLEAKCCQKVAGARINYMIGGSSFDQIGGQKSQLITSSATRRKVDAELTCTRNLEFRREELVKF